MRLYSEWIEDQQRGAGGDDFGEERPRRRRRRRRLVRRRSREAREDDRPRRRKKKVRKVRRKRMPDGRIVEVIEMVEEADVPEEFPVDDELEDAIDEAEAAPDDEGAVEELGAILRDGWGQVARVGNLRIQPKAGLRAAVMELKPGLYIVAEIPERAIDDLGGPVKMAVKITEAVQDALSRPPLPPPPKIGQAATWRERAIERRCRCRWEQE